MNIKDTHPLVLHPLIGFSAAFIGTLLDHFFGGLLDDIGETIGPIGFGYGCISFIAISAAILIKHVKKRTAMNDLIKLKELLTKELLTQEEYNKKVNEIKKLIL
jgi:hypothetical protein